MQTVDPSGTSACIWCGPNYLMETDGSNVTDAVYTNEPDVYGKLISQRRNA